MTQKIYFLIIALCIGTTASYVQAADFSAPSTTVTSTGGTIIIVNITAQPVSITQSNTEVTNETIAVDMAPRLYMGTICLEHWYIKAKGRQRGSCAPRKRYLYCHQRQQGGKSNQLRIDSSTDSANVSV